MTTAIELYRVYWQRQIAIASALGLPRPVIGGRLQRKVRVPVPQRILVTKEAAAEQIVEQHVETHNRVYEEIRRAFEWEPSAAKEES